jgi:ribonuclease HI
MSHAAHPTRIWLAADWNAVYRCGGWAWLRQAGGVLSGAVGGERQVSAERIELAGLAAALADLPKDAAVTVETPSARLAAAAPWIASEAAGADAPEDDLDLWARITTGAQGRKVRIVRAPVEPRTPSAFSAAWAELARDKAKATGPFTAAIPKVNLAKVKGLGEGV